MNIPVFDFHCDTALALLGQNMNSAGDLRKNNHHIDLERASTLAGYAQCFACFTTTDYMEERRGISPILAFERELATIQWEVDRNSDLISIAYSTADIRENLEKAGCAFLAADRKMIPTTTTEVTDPEVAAKVEKLLDWLEDFDDTQNVFHDAELPEDEEE